MSIPTEPGQPVRRPALEPTHVQRRRRSEALAELVRQVREDDGGADSDEGYESIAVPSTATRLLPPPEEYETQELPPVLAGRTTPGAQRGSPPRPGGGTAAGTDPGAASACGAPRSPSPSPRRRWSASPSRSCCRAVPRTTHPEPGPSHRPRPRPEPRPGQPTRTAQAPSGKATAAPK